MKYVMALLAAGGVYMWLAGHPPGWNAVHTKPAVESDESAAGSTDFLKASLDRTHDVLKQARTRAGDPALQ